jgi:hypothetical protein
VDFAGDAHDLRFLAPDPETNGAWAYIAVSNKDDGIAVRVTPELGDGRIEVEGRTIHGALALSYYGAKKGAQQPQWYRDWRSQPRLPTLVRVEVRNARGLESSVDVPLRVDAPADCVFNPLTRDCQER